MIAGRTLEAWIQKYPLLADILAEKEVAWVNPRYGTFERAQNSTPLSEADIRDAEERLRRFAPYIARVFPETQQRGGIIESPLVGIPAMRQHLARELGWETAGTLLLKCDSHLAISGSIKARGGIYEVLKHAEDLALEHGLITTADHYAVLDSRRFREFFARYSIAVGSTGNLGLSIGIMGRKLGFQVVVHMSSDAKSWKKALLRQKGVTVIEHPSDYSKAVEAGRKEAGLDPNVYFVDDESSTDLFLGYAVAASRLQGQLAELSIPVDEEHPLFVYLPCGVGGSPGGITFGLKQIFQDQVHVEKAREPHCLRWEGNGYRMSGDQRPQKGVVHCFFAEPTACPCMLLGLMTGLYDRVSVQDFGLDGATDADGLAVGRPSAFVGKAVEQMISGVYTVRDETL
jgi:D-serine dehydratase